MTTIPEQRLWQHVLLALLADLRSPGTKDYRNQEFARRWVGSYPSKDFQMVCVMAGFEIEPAHRYFRQLCENSHSLQPSMGRAGGEGLRSMRPVKGGASDRPGRQAGPRWRYPRPGRPSADRSG